VSEKGVISRKMTKLLTESRYGTSIDILHNGDQNKKPVTIYLDIYLMQIVTGRQ
jgi:hypothetical protein